MKILYDFYLSKAYSYARVKKKSKKVKAHTSQRPKRPELIQVSLAWNMPKGMATVAYSTFPCDSGSSVSR